MAAPASQSQLDAADRLQAQRDRLLEHLRNLANAIEFNPSKPTAWARDLFEARALITELELEDRHRGDRRSGIDRRAVARPGPDRRQTERRSSDRRATSGASLLDAYEQTLATGDATDLNKHLEP